MFYQPSNRQWSELFESTKLQQMKYKPNLFALNATMQIVICTALSTINTFFKRVKYTREIFSLSDGGELAVDWLINSADENSKSPPKRDIVVCVPGLSGDSGEFYCVTLAEACLKANLDFVVINYRGTSGVPLKVSPRSNLLLSFSIDSSGLQRG